MAAVFPSAFDSNSAISRYFPLARKRLVVALVLSALVHLWLAAGMAVDVPVRVGAQAPAILIARLEAPVAAALPPQPESAVAEKIARQDSRSGGGRPVAGGVARSSAIDPAPAPLSASEAREPRASGAALPLTPDPVYYPARQLDVYPALLQSIRLEYPHHAAQSQVSGNVLMMLLIDEAGRVNEISIAAAEPAGYFENAVRLAFADARFSPARKHGRAVKSRVLIRINYNSGAAEGAMR